MSGHGHAGGLPAPQTPLRAGERFEDLSMARPYTPAPPSGGTDDYRCFLVDPGITAPTYLTGSQFLPGNPELLHHAIFFKLTADQVAAAQRKDASTTGDGWTCFSGTGIQSGAGAVAGQLRSAAWLAAWAPGGGENVTPKGTAFELDPGDRIVMQIHYNLLATGGKAPGADTSGIRLRLAPATGAVKPLHTTLLVAPVELPCPKGESGALCDRETSVLDSMHRFGPEAGTTVAGLNLLCNANRTPVPGDTHHCDRTMRQRMTVYSVAGHMHLLGRSITVDLDPGTSGSRRLLDVANYNFDDQRARPLARPTVVDAGDTLRVTCRYDAKLRSQLPSLRTLPPGYVVWGEGTSDEMCLGVVLWA